MWPQGNAKLKAQLNSTASPNKWLRLGTDNINCGQGCGVPTIPELCQQE